MTLQPFQRILSIKAAAAGPYVVVGLCHDCGSEQPLVNFPRPFALAIAVCRRCRFTRTGVEDRRGLIQGDARISRPLEELTPVRIAGLLLPGPPIPRPVAPLTELTMTTIDGIFAPWGTNPGEDPDDLEDYADLEKVERELDELLLALDRHTSPDP